MANFSTVQRVQQTIRAGDWVERVRQDNRVKVSNAANCFPPLTKDEARKIGLKINVNWGSMMILLAHARRQFMSAYWSSENLFRVKMPYAPKETQSEWESFITNEINRPLRESDSYFNQHDYRWASVVTHGAGPMIWYDQDNWENDFVAMGDLRIPTDTTTDFKNLSWFGVRHLYTPYELITRAFDSSPKNRWNKKAVASILKNYKEVNFVDATMNYDWETSPQKLADLIKQDGGYYAGDAFPAIPFWHFYFLDNTDKDNSGWFMRVVPETGNVRGPDVQEFLWSSEFPVAKKLSEIMQCQIGDLSTETPFKYQAVRSLGYALLEPEFYENLTRCRLLQHVQDNFNIWLRTTDPVDKARAQVQEFSNLCMLRSGIQVVPQTERHQIDSGLVEMVMAQMRQLKAEASSTYTQQSDTGTKREQTAFETNVKVQQVNAMLSGLLMKSFKRSGPEYREMSRRFCNYKSSNEDVKRFQDHCRKFGIPRQHMDPKLWIVEPVTPLGMGNPTVAQASTQQLMAIRGAYEPSAQQEILHEATLVLTGDPRKAARWAPLGGQRDVSGGEEYAASVFGTLMEGVPVRSPERISPIEQMDAMIPMFAGKIAAIQARDNVGSIQEIMGLGNVQKYMLGLIDRISQDDQQKQRVKQYSDVLAKLFNEVKGFQQRLIEKTKQEAQMGNNGGTQASDAAKAQNLRIQGAIKGKVALDKAQLSNRIKETSHVREQRRQDAASFAQIQRTNLESKAKLAGQLAKASVPKPQSTSE